MPVEVRLPQWGMNMQEGTVTEWLKSEGEHVAQGQPLVTIEAAKAVETVDAPASGILAVIHVREGQTVPVRTLLCTIVESDEPAQATGSTLAAEPAPHPDTASGERLIASASAGNATPVARRLAEAHGLEIGRIRGSGRGGQIVHADVLSALAEVQTAPIPEPSVQVEPRARRLAKEQNIDLGNVSGSGSRGRITEEDVRRAIQAATRPAASTVVPFVGMRGSIAQNMLSSLHAMAQLTLFSEVDVTDLVLLKETLKQQFDVTYTDLFVRAVALALKEHPRLNARVDGDGIHLIQAVHVGVAVSLDEGLIVPVVRDTDRKTTRQIGAEIRDLAQRARAGQLGASEVSGGTFTVTNLGPYGVDSFTPIVNPPEAAILGVGRIREKLTRRDGDLLWRRATTLSLTFDHRAVDGAPAAAFLKAIADLMQNPDRLGLTASTTLMQHRVHNRGVNHSLHLPVGQFDTESVYGIVYNIFSA